MDTEEEITRLRLDPQREKYEARQRAERYVQDTEEDSIKLNLDQARNEYNMRMAAEQEEREPYSTKPEEKMGLLLFLPLLFLCIIGDLIDIFTGGTIGWFIGLFIDGVLLIAIGLTRAGRKQFARVLIMVFGDSWPFLAVVPFRTAGLVWAFVSSRSKIAKKVSYVAKKVV